MFLITFSIKLKKFVLMDFDKLRRSWDEFRLVDQPNLKANSRKAHRWIFSTRGSSSISAEWMAFLEVISSVKAHPPPLHQWLHMNIIGKYICFQWLILSVNTNTFKLCKKWINCHFVWISVSLSHLLVFSHKVILNCWN